VGDVAADPDLWDFCGDAAVREAVAPEGAGQVCYGWNSYGKSPCPKSPTRRWLAHQFLRVAMTPVTGSYRGPSAVLAGMAPNMSGSD
jgi:hypothetical protein